MKSEKKQCFAIGIVCAKANSKRFPGKNIYDYKGAPLFYHSVLALMGSNMIDKIYVSTDSEEIIEFCKKKNINVISRNQNVIYDEEPLLSVLKYSYQTLDISAKYICTIMANCPGHKSETIDMALELIEKEELNEIRSYNNKSTESGLIILKEHVLLSAPSISSHIGLVKSDVNEIHYKFDLLESEE